MHCLDCKESMSHLAPSHVIFVSLKVITDLFFFFEAIAGMWFNHIDKKKFSVANHTDLSDIWPIQQKHKLRQGHD